MGVPVTELPTSLHDVDVIIAGGKFDTGGAR